MSRENFDQLHENDNKRVIRVLPVLERQQEVGILKKQKLALTIAAAVVVSAAGLASASEPKPLSINIKSQPASAALVKLAKDSGVQIMLSTELGDSIQTTEIQGSYTLSGALEKMLQGTGLVYEFKSDNFVVIKAQDSEASGENTEQESNDIDEEIVVTGSRIARTPSQLAANVIVLDAKALQATGESTLEGALRQLPQNIFGASPVGATVAGSASFHGAINVAGASSINLRGLGAESTLILVDGRRIGHSGVFGGVSDITGIPLRSIERVEILLDGASSIYGSDAVGGVVNVITKKNFEGGEINYQYGAPEAGGFEEHVFTVSGSKSWGSGRVQAVFEHFQNSNLDGQERPQRIGNSSYPNSGGIVRGFPAAVVYQGRRYLPSEFFPLVGLPADTPAWRISRFVPSSEWIRNAFIPADQDGANLLWTDFDLYDVGSGFINSDASGGISLIGPQKRYNLSLGFDQELQLWGNDMMLRGSIYYSQRAAYSANGAFELEANLLDHPTNPFDSNTRVGWRVESLPARHFQSDTEVFRWNLSLNGQIGDSWRWELGVGESEEKLDSAFFNQSILARYGIDPLFTELVDSGLNLWAGDLEAYNSPELLSRLVVPQQNTNSVNGQSTFDFNANGALFQLPGGDMRLSIGSEWRQIRLMSSSDRFITQSSLSSSGLGLDSGATQSFPPPVYQVEQQSKTQSAAFTELFLPIFGVDNAVNGIQRLNITGSARYESYQGRGSGSTWSLGVIWSPIEQVTFKARHSTSYVVPTFRDQLAETTIFDTTDNPVAAAIVDENNQTVGFDFIGSFIGGGNPDLQPETADTRSVGLEIMPDFVSGLTLRAAWTETLYSNRIGAPPPVFPFVSGSNYDTIYGTTLYRDDMGLLVFDQRIKNTAYVETSGVDYQLEYLKETGIGQFYFSVNIARTGKYVKVQNPGDEPVNLLADTEIATRMVLPTYGYSAQLGWDYHGLSVDLNTHTRSSTVSTTFSRGEPSGQRITNYAIDADLRIGYDLDQGDWLAAPNWLKGTAVSLRVLNLLNDYADYRYIELPGGEPSPLSELNANVSDPRGRFFYLDITKRF